MHSASEVEIDRASESEWYRYLDGFRDASIYQTWAYASAAGGRAPSSVVLREGGEIAAMALVRVARIPVLGCGIAHIAWGPLWQRLDRPSDPGLLARILRALRSEYVVRRGLFLQIAPNIVRDGVDTLPGVIAGEGFRRRVGKVPYRTVLVDLRPPLPEIRSRLRPRFRGYLNKVETAGLTVSLGTSDEMFEALGDIYGVMRARKGFDTEHTPDKFRAVQSALPEWHRMPILLALERGRAVAGLVASIAGDAALYLLGATSERGLQTRAAYLLHWRMMELAKARGCQWYDLCGIDPVRDPGGYQFKSGFRGRECEHLGTFDLCRRWLSRASVHAGEALRRLRSKWTGPRVPRR